MGARCPPVGTVIEDQDPAGEAPWGATVFSQIKLILLPTHQLVLFHYIYLISFIAISYILSTLGSVVSTVIPMMSIRYFGIIVSMFERIVGSHALPVSRVTIYSLHCVTSSCDVNGAVY